MIDLQEAGRRLSGTRVGPTPPMAKLEALRSRRARRPRTVLVASATAAIFVVVGLVVSLAVGSPRNQRVTTAPPASPTLSPAAAVEAAVARTEAAGSAQFALTATTSGRASNNAPIPGGSTLGSGATSITGMVNFAADEVTMTIYNGPPGHSAKTAEVRVLGRIEYQGPVPPNRTGPDMWYKSVRPHVLEQFDFVFVPLSQKHIAVSQAGTTTLQGTPSTVYDVHIAAAKLDGVKAPLYVIRVWLDGQGRIRQASTTRPAANTPQDITQTVSFSDFGVPVSVTAPTPAAPSTTATP